MEADARLATFFRQRTYLYTSIDQLRVAVDGWFVTSPGDSLTDLARLEAMLAQKQALFQEMAALEQSLMDYLIESRKRKALY